VLTALMSLLSLTALVLLVPASVLMTLGEWLRRGPLAWSTERAQRPVTDWTGWNN
jgi:hypothetical protein